MSFSIAQEDSRLAMTPISSLYTHDMRAMGRKLAASFVGPFLWISIVAADFQAAGTSLASKQWAKISSRILQEGSTRLRCLYSTLSGPGHVFAAERSFLLISGAVGGLKRDSSMSAEGTCSSRALCSTAVSQGFWPNMLVKKVSTSETEPE